MIEMPRLAKWKKRRQRRIFSTFNPENFTSKYLVTNEIAVLSCSSLISVQYPNSSQSPSVTTSPRQQANPHQTNPTPNPTFNSPRPPPENKIKKQSRPLFPQSKPPTNPPRRPSLNPHTLPHPLLNPPPTPLLQIVRNIQPHKRPMRAPKIPRLQCLPNPPNRLGSQRDHVGNAPVETVARGPPWAVLGVESRGDGDEGVGDEEAGFFLALLLLF